MRFETPYLRPEIDLFSYSKNSTGQPPTRFFGVKRITERIKVTSIDGDYYINKATGKFGIEFPAFDRNSKTGKILESRTSDDENDLPGCAKIGDSKILLRNDLDKEDVAGQLYSFVYRLLFGKKKANDLHIKLSQSNEKSTISDTSLITR